MAEYNITFRQIEQATNFWASIRSNLTYYQTLELWGLVKGKEYWQVYQIVKNEVTWFSFLPDSAQKNLVKWHNALCRTEDYRVSWEYIAETLSFFSMIPDTVVIFGPKLWSEDYLSRLQSLYQKCQTIAWSFYHQLVKEDRIKLYALVMEVIN